MDEITAVKQGRENTTFDFIISLQRLDMTGQKEWEIKGEII